LRLVVISDIHANYDALAAVLQKIRDFDYLVCLGDLVGYGPQPNEVVEQIRDLNLEVVIMGNHDYATVTADTINFVTHAARAIEWTRQTLKPENLHFLSKLPHYATKTLGETVVASYHGSPRDPLNEYVYPGGPQFMFQALVEEAAAKLLLLGHTHIPFISSTPSGVIVNPGSIGQPRDGDARSSYATIEISNGKINCSIERTSYDIESAAGKIVQKGLPTFLADRLFLGI
jgi:predicted phosphodiesterase